MLSEGPPALLVALVALAWQGSGHGGRDGEGEDGRWLQGLAVEMMVLLVVWKCWSECEWTW